MLDIIFLFIFLAMVLAPCMVGLHIYATDRPVDDSGEILNGATAARD